ncbi:MAG: asparagine synthase-related protein [Candidatus Yanofskybacteria bacterium]|nr:asparagine synthase-related protein [Candidatus Yanofskybacteria bacterium]
MHLIVGEQNRIEFSSLPLQEGLNCFGTVYGIVNSNYEVSEKQLPQGVSPTHIDGEGIFVLVRDGRFVWAAPDCSGVCDLFYGVLKDGKYILGNDFFEILASMKSTTLHQENTKFFLRQGYFPPGATFFQEVFRVRVGMKFMLRAGRGFEESAWTTGNQEAPRTYEAFQGALRSALEVRKEKDVKEAIFLSAGVDSGLLAALNRHAFHTYPLAVTVKYKQTLKINEIDAVGAQRIAEHLGLEHRILTLDFNEEHPSVLKDMVLRMPLAAHLSLAFLKMSKEAVQAGAMRVWCGQNADSVYNLGPTEKSLGGPAKRFYLSKEYWRSLSDIKDRSVFDFFYRRIGACGTLAFRLKRGFEVRQPHTFRELLHAFEESEEYIMLPPKAQKAEVAESFLTYQEAKRLFFDRKAQSFLTGRDPRSVRHAAQQEGVHAFLPYSAANMMNFFRGLELGLRDVFQPKRYIYQYLQEVLGKKHYERLYRSPEKYLPRVPYLNWQEWQKHVLFGTIFWSELRKEVRGGDDLGILGRTSGQLLNQESPYHIIDLYWLQNVLRKVEELGVIIHNKSL